MQIRHFTASGIVLHQGSVLLIEHARLRWWMPPGGHLEPNEDPVQAVLREVAEETGLACEIVSADGFGHPAIEVLPPPLTILVENVPENGIVVQHIDCIYVLRPAADPAQVSGHATETTSCQWVPLDRVADLSGPPELPALVRAAADYAATVAGAAGDQPRSRAAGQQPGRGTAGDQPGAGGGW
jgi:8-oxo-dGTP diphosphatase